MSQSFARRDALILALALAAIVAVTAAFRIGLHLTNPTTAALSYLLIVLVTAAASTLWAAIAASCVTTSGKRLTTRTRLDFSILFIP